MKIKEKEEDNNKMVEILTSLDVVNQSFKKSLRGYDVVEVDEFLDAIAETLQYYAQETKDLRNALSEKEASLNEYEKMKNVLQEALILAQKSADERVRSAKEQAKKIIADAEKKAEITCAEAAGEAGRLREGVYQIKNIRTLYEQEVRELVAKYEEIIDNIDSDSNMKEAVDSVLEVYEEEKARDKEASSESGDGQELELEFTEETIDKEELAAAYDMLGVNPDEILKEEFEEEESLEEQEEEILEEEN